MASRTSNRSPRVRSGRVRDPNAEADESTATSSRTRRSAPPPAPPWLWAIFGLVMIGVVVSFVFFLRSHSQPTATPVAESPSQQLHRVESLYQQGLALYRDAMRNDDGRLRSSGLHSAQKRLTEAGDAYEAVLGKYRDEEDELPARYRGYEALRANIDRALYNVAKSMPIN